MGVAAVDLSYSPLPTPAQPDDPSSVPVKRRLRKQKVRFRYRESLDPDAVNKIVRKPSARRAAATARIVEDPTFRTFLEEWDAKISYTICRLGLGDHVDDVKQDIYLFMSRPHCPKCGEEMECCKRHGKPRVGEEKCEACPDDAATFAYCGAHRIHRSKGKNGLELYDPAKASFSAYVYHLANLKTLNYRAKLGRDRLTLSPKGKDPELQGDRKASKPWEKTHFWMQLEALAAEHAERAPDDGFFDDDGRYVTRDPRTVVGLLIEGHTRPEIAKILRCAVAVVDDLVLALRDNPEIRALLAVASVDESEA